MAVGKPRAEMLANWVVTDEEGNQVFTTSPPPEELTEATEADVRALREADGFELVEEVEPEEEAGPASPRDRFEVIAAAIGTTADRLRQIVREKGYADESRKLYIGRAFAPLEFAAWWCVQALGTLPFNGVGVHHTAIPDRNTFQGLQHIHNIFSYYRTQLGWPAGKGPHLWLRSARPGRVPGPVVYVGTHPAHDGIGISYRNHRWLHAEFIDRFDAYGMSAEDHWIYRFVLRVVCAERGIPLKHTGSDASPGRGWDGPKSPMDGYLFHRFARTDVKSCPGSMVHPGPFGEEMRKSEDRDDGGGSRPPGGSPETKTLHKVQVGAYSVYANARRQQDVAQRKGFRDAFVVREGNLYKVQLGAFSDPKNAEERLAEAKARGFSDAFIAVKKAPAR